MYAPVAHKTAAAVQPNCSRAVCHCRAIMLVALFFDVRFPVVRYSYVIAMVYAKVGAKNDTRLRPRTSAAAEPDRISSFLIAPGNLYGLFSVRRSLQHFVLFKCRMVLKPPPSVALVLAGARAACLR